MKTVEKISHVDCDTCGFKEPVDYQTIAVSSGDIYVICKACLIILGNMDAVKVFSIGFKAGKFIEGKRLENVAD